jgi:hypothetical protein
LGKPEDLQIISKNIGLRRKCFFRSDSLIVDILIRSIASRRGGTRVEAERATWDVPVVHCYGHAGTGYQSSWGTAERVLELVEKTLGFKAKL